MTGGAARVAQLTLLSRAYCHLCDEMRAALTPIAARHAIPIVVIDVDGAPALEARYGDRVPVLFAGTPDGGVEVCHYTLDQDAVHRALSVAR